MNEAPPFDRVHACVLDAELDWLPKQLRAYRATKVVLGASGVALTLGGALEMTSLGTVAAVGLAVGVVTYFGAITVGDRVGRWVVRKRALALVRGRTELRELPGRRNRALVRVEGTVRAKPSKTPPGDTGTVFRRLVYEDPSRRLFVQELANDFEIVSADGTTVSVEVSEARLLVPHDTNSILLPMDTALAVVPRGLQHAAFWADTAVREGDRVHVLGWTDLVVDPSQTDRLHRDTPFRNVLRGADELPLLVSLV